MRNWQSKLFIAAMVVLLAPGVRSASADCEGKAHAACEKGADCDKAAPCEKGAACEKACEKGADCKTCEKGAACQGEAHASSAVPEPKPGEAVYVLGIEGMSCPEACPPHVKESLESIDGVRSVEVSFADKRAIVKTDAGVELTSAEIDKSFHNRGYSVSSLEKVPAK